MLTRFRRGDMFVVGGIVQYEGESRQRMLGIEAGYLFPIRRGCILLLEIRLRPDPSVEAQEISQVLFTLPHSLRHKRVNRVGDMLKSTHKTAIMAGMPESPFL